MGILSKKENQVKGKIIHFVLRPPSSSPVFLSTGVIGEVVSRTGGKITLRDVCLVYEQVGRRQTDGELIIGTKYYTHSQISNGEPVFKEEDILWERVVDSEAEKKEFLSGYYSALEAFKNEKSNILRATQVPPHIQPPHGRA